MKPYAKNLIILIVLVLCYVWLRLSNTNFTVFLFINKQASVLPDWFWENATILGDSFTGVLIMLMLIRKRPDLVLAGIGAALFATLLVNGLKSYYNVARPPEIFDHTRFTIIGPEHHWRSFPSGHNVSIFIIYGLLVHYFKKWYSLIPLVIISCIAGVSRIAVGVHWPADCLAGAAIGLFFAILASFLIEKFRVKPGFYVKLIIGLLLLVSTIYYVLFYNTGYNQAIYLQTAFGVISLITGIYQIALLILEKKRGYPFKVPS